ncbi:MAG: radical SAM protein [Phycisphaerae bacterium]|nr:radical SAM protein [Phycisphaerae bacterium]
MDPQRAYACLVEPEYQRDGRLEDVATIFITNKECPFRCLMCDLWTHTTRTRSRPGMVIEQIRHALSELAPAPHVKLYNAGNFFDAQAVPPTDLPDIARLVKCHRTVIIECHPRLVNDRCTAFADLIDGRLEVAMGLETVDLGVLPLLNKRMTLDDYRKAAEFLLARGIGVRAFILLRAPFQSEADGLHWAMRSLDWAFSIGVECCVVIPTRPGNGALDALQGMGQFSPPQLASLETAVEYGLSLGRGRVFADLWDAHRFIVEAEDAARIDRIAQMNATQCRPSGAGTKAKGRAARA